jgi:YD repeat-containing protein
MFGPGLLISDADRNGNTISFAYNAAQQLTTATDTEGRALSFTYNGDGTPIPTTRWHDAHYPTVWVGATYLNGRGERTRADSLSPIVAGSRSRTYRATLVGSGIRLRDVPSNRPWPSQPGDLGAVGVVSQTRSRSRGAVTNACTSVGNGLSTAAWYASPYPAADSASSHLGRQAAAVGSRDG